MTGDPKEISRKLWRWSDGSTLLEIVVTLGLFLLIMTAMISLFTQMLQAERKAFATQAALDNARYTLEIMARAIRLANPNTLVVSGSGNQTLTFHDNDYTAKDCPNTSATSSTMFYTRTVTAGVGAIAEYSNTTVPGCTGGGAAIPITSTTAVDIQNLGFYVNSNGVVGEQQPRVTIIAKVVAPSNPSVTANIQTTVDLRALQ